MHFPSTFEIGFKFNGKQTPKSKRTDEYTVIDIETTTNSIGKVVRVEYVLEHIFLGQKVESRAIRTTICRMMMCS